MKFVKKARLSKMNLSSKLNGHQRRGLHSPHHYDESYQLRISPLLWLVLLYGLRHITLFFATIFVVGFQPFDSWRMLQSQTVLMMSDVLVLAVLFVAGHRLENAHPRWRILWNSSRHVLMLAFGLDLLLLGGLHGSALLAPQDDTFVLAWALTVADGMVLFFLHRSVLVRDIFADFPEVKAPKVKPALAAQNLPVDTDASSAQQAHNWHAQGMAAMQASNLTQAIVLLRKAVGLAPDNAAFARNLGEMYRRTGNTLQAVFFCQQACQLDSANADGHFNLALAYFDSGKLDDAAEAFRAALAINPKHLNALNNLGVLLLYQNDQVGAKAAFEQVLAFDPSNVLATGNMKNLG